MTKKIMIVDDEAGITYTVKHGLEGLKKEYQVTCVDSGKKCLELLEQNQIPDLILLDIMMPGMSGWDVAARIKQNDRWRSVPIVFLTAKGDEMSVGIGHLASEDYIVKPFDIMKLKDCVKRILTKPPV